MRRKQNIVPIVICIILIVCLVAGLAGIVVNRRNFVKLTYCKIWNSDSKEWNSDSKEQQISTQISIGERILGTEDLVLWERKEGVIAFNKKDYFTALDNFQSSLQQNPNDPQTLIYLNNAKAALLGSFKIAVSVPLSTNRDVALEILRGVAHAQHEVNCEDNNIKGKLLQVAIANDNNNPDTVPQIADQFVREDSNVLAVVGHNKSNVSLAAAKRYDNKLVMISPTSTANDLTNKKRRYVFRTVPKSGVEVNTLYNYANENIRGKIAICYDEQDSASRAFKTEFIQKYNVNNTLSDCNFSAPNFNASTAVSLVHANSEVKGLLLLPSVDKIDQAIEIARANTRANKDKLTQEKVSLLSYSVMYARKTLELGKKDVVGMVMTAPWHPDQDENAFSGRATRLWGGREVNWRTAMAYDATQAIIQGLKSSQSNTIKDLRKELQAKLHTLSSIKGVKGDFKFLETGDRNLNPILTEIVSKNSPNPIYEFKLGTD